MINKYHLKDENGQTILVEKDIVSGRSNSKVLTTQEHLSVKKFLDELNTQRNQYLESFFQKS